jgi:hypothetical protein
MAYTCFEANAERKKDWYCDKHTLFPEESQGVVTSALGGKQSSVEYAFDEMPYDALLKVANVFKVGGQKYGADNWKKLSIPEILNHSIGHQLLHLKGDREEDHLANAASRALMALQLHLESKQ